MADLRSVSAALDLDSVALSAGLVAGRGGYGPCPGCGADRRSRTDDRAPLDRRRGSGAPYLAHHCGWFADALDLVAMGEWGAPVRDLDSEGKRALRRWLVSEGHATETKGHRPRKRARSTAPAIPSWARALPFLVRHLESTGLPWATVRARYESKLSADRAASYRYAPSHEVADLWRWAWTFAGDVPPWRNGIRSARDCGRIDDDTERARRWLMARTDRPDVLTRGFWEVADLHDEGGARLLPPGFVGFRWPSWFPYGPYGAHRLAVRMFALDGTLAGVSARRIDGVPEAKVRPPKGYDRKRTYLGNEATRALLAGELAPGDFDAVWVVEGLTDTICAGLVAHLTRRRVVVLGCDAGSWLGLADVNWPRCVRSGDVPVYLRPDLDPTGDGYASQGAYALTSVGVFPSYLPFSVPLSREASP